MYLGLAELDFSKWKMYDVNYQYMKLKFQEKLLLNYILYTFIYIIRTEDLYKDMQNDSFVPKGAHHDQHPTNQAVAKLGTVPGAQ